MPIATAATPAFEKATMNGLRITLRLLTVIKELDRTGSAACKDACYRLTTTRVAKFLMDLCKGTC